MNTVKKIIAIALVMIIGINFVQAQRNGGGKKSPLEKATKVTERMSSELGLSTQQSNQVKGILLDLFTETKEMKASGEVDRTAMKSLRTEANSKLESVLSTSQFEQYMAMKEERREHKGERGGKDGKMEGRLEKLTEELNLSASQVTQLESIFETHRTAFKAAKEAEDREAMKGLKKELKEDMRNVLSADQLERFEELREERRGERGRGGKGNRGGGRG